MENLEACFHAISESARRVLSCSAHSWDHVERVYNLCMTLAEGQQVDLGILRASALLHDVGRVQEDADPSGKTDHAFVGAEMARSILEKAGFPAGDILRIQKCILQHRYRSDNQPDTLEAKILFDADKLDSLGAVGIARSFIWVGKNNARLYRKTDINQYIQENLGGKMNGRIQDKTIHSPQIEFETKLKFIGEHLYTDRAKEIYAERYAFYRDFLSTLEKEVLGLC